MIRLTINQADGFIHKFKFNFQKIASSVKHVFMNERQRVDDSNQNERIKNS